jgi:hypothetical protein
MESDYNRYRKIDINEEIDSWMSSQSLLSNQEKIEREQIENDFLDYWEDIKAFAEQNRLSVSYVESEFLIDGELFPVHLTFPEDE